MTTVQLDFSKSMVAISIGMPAAVTISTKVKVIWEVQCLLPAAKAQSKARFHGGCPAHVHVESVGKHHCYPGFSTVFTLRSPQHFITSPSGASKKTGARIIFRSRKQLGRQQIMTLTRRSFLVAATATSFVGLLTTRVSAQTPMVYANDGIAVDGSDVVAYFTEGRPVAGSADYSVDWMGVTWYFASAENLSLFAANPEAYAPQYGGYCAWAVSQGYTASTTPEAWKVVDGKLYLNYSPRIQRRWEKDIPGHITAADKNWPDALS